MPNQPHHDGHQCQQHREPHPHAGQGPAQRKHQGGDQERGRHHGDGRPAGQCLGQAKMEYGLSARTSGWLMVFPRLVWYAWRARCSGPVVDSTRSVAVRVVVAVAHGGTRAPCPSCCRSAGGAHAPRTRPCSACCPGCRTGAGLHAKGPGLRPQARGWRRAGLRQRGRCRAARAVMLPRRLVGGGRLGLRIGAGLGLALALRRPSWVRAAQLVPPGLEPQRCPPRATPRQAQQSRVPPGRRLYRGGGGAAGAGGTTAGLASAGAAG